MSDVMAEMASDYQRKNFDLQTQLCHYRGRVKAMRDRLEMGDDDGFRRIARMLVEFDAEQELQEQTNG